MNRSSNSGFKIVHLSTVHAPDDNRIYRKELLSLKNAGFNVALIARKSQNIEINQITHIMLPAIRNRFLRMTLLPFNAFLKVIKGKFQIIHFHDPELLPIAGILRLMGKKIIYDVHENYPEQIMTKKYLPSFLKKPLSKTISLLENLLAKRFSLIVVVVEDLKKRFLKYNSNTIIIANYPKLEDFSSYLNNLSQKKSEPPQNIIYMGGITSIRGVREIIKASNWTKLPIVLLGPIQEKALVPLLTENIKSTSNFTYLGKIPFDKLHDYLKNSLAGLVLLHPTPNYLHSLPVKLFEYMAAGLPVIASDFPLWRQIIQENECGICVNPLDPKAIADAINYYVDNPEIAGQHGANGQKLVLEKYNWEKEAEKLVDAYNRLLEKA